MHLLKKLLCLSSIISYFCLSASALHAETKTVRQTYGTKICNEKGFHCVKIKRRDRWGTLFPDLKQRDLVKRLNRTNLFLKPGMIIAVPDNLEHITLFDISPFKLHIKSEKEEKSILIDQKLLAFGVYNEYGQLLRWGPISAGSDKCFESDSCKTPIGTFYALRKKGEDCFSGSLPLISEDERGGAYMPYCIYFNAGFALHGSEHLPGYNTSHGCVRLFVEDAKWLNNYVDLAKDKSPGTKIVILPS